MVLWPFGAKHCGLPTTVRDAGMDHVRWNALRLSSYLRDALGW